MNDHCEQFRQVQTAQKLAGEKVEALNSIGSAIEKAIELKLDVHVLAHPEIIDKMLELHKLVTWERFPQIEATQKRIETPQEPVDNPEGEIEAIPE